MHPNDAARLGMVTGDWVDIASRRGQITARLMVTGRCVITFEYDPMLVPNPKLIVDILADAGGRIGVGDYRPACGGWFGRFNIIGYWLE